MKIKNALRPFIPKSGFKDLIKIMRISLFMLFAITFQMLATNTKAQDAVVELKSNSVSVKQLINEIEKQTDYLVVFSNREVNTSRKVTVKKRSDKVSTILNEVFGDTDIDYDFENNYIVLSKNAQQSAAFIADVIAGQQQQKNRVTGTVVDEHGEPIIGANIIEKGTSNGTVTDFDGNFVLEVADGAALLVSYIGYLQQEISTAGRSSVSITLVEDTQALDELVVTALGIKREEKALGYAVQKVDGDIIQTAKEPNLLSNLTGKVAGLNIQNPPGLYEDPRISLRGSSNILVVVDNVPVEKNFWNLSADDIAEMSVLKGPAAAALYGSRGKDGAILITTKRGGGKDGKMEISINSSSMFQPSFVFMPKTQSLYGSGDWGEYSWVDGAGAGTYDSDSYAWGPKLDQKDPSTPSGFVEIVQWDSPIDPETNKRIPTPFTSRGKNNLKNFFRTGAVLSNNIALGATTENTHYRLSLTQFDQIGIDPNARVDGTTIAVSGGHKFNDKFSVESALNYNKQYTDNYPRTSYYSDNNMYNILVWMPSDIDVTNMKDYWVPGSEGIKQRNFNYSYYNNPYFIANEYLQEYKKDVVYGFASIGYKINPDFNLTLRSNINSISLYRAEKRPKGFVGYSANYINGGFYPNYTNNFDLNNEFLFTYNKNFNSNWGINALFGGNNRINQYRYMSVSATALSIPGVYNVGNSAVPVTTSNSISEKLVNSLYASTDISYRNAIYLTLTGRNDWSSGMPVKNNSYFYPSVALSGVITELIKFPDPITFAKLRASWIKVGGDMAPYSSRPTYSYGTIWGTTPTIYLGGTLYPETIKPDFKETYELGADFRFIKNRLGFDLTYFEDTYSNMITTSSISSASGYSSQLINSDKITRKKGWEVSFRATPIQIKDFTWDLTLNWSLQHDYLVKAESGKEGRDGYVKEGERYGDWIFKNEFDRTPDGQLIIKNGFPAISAGNTNLGYGNSKWDGGLQSNFKYKNWYLSVSIDGRWGGLLYSRLNQKLWESGKHIDSANETYRDADNDWRNQDKSYVGEGVVVVSGEAVYDSEGFLVSDNRVFEPNTTKVYYRDWVNSYYSQSIYESNVFDATFFKLRELTLSYMLPKEYLRNVFIKDIELSLIGRNLYLWTKEKSSMDPDMKGDAGETRLYVPTPRNIGFNIKLKF